MVLHRDTPRIRTVASFTWGAGRRRVSIRWAERDPWRAATVSAAVMLALGWVFAQFGLPNVPLMWPLYRVEVVLPGCGLTRGAVAIFRGDLGRAWTFNPTSFLAVLLAGLLTTRLAIGALTGRWLVARLRHRSWYLIIGVPAVAALWVNQQLHAQFLMHNSR